jgi:hypothetical protein
LGRRPDPLGDRRLRQALLRPRLPVVRGLSSDLWPVWFPDRQQQEVRWDRLGRQVFGSEVFSLSSLRPWQDEELVDAGLRVRIPLHADGFARAFAGARIGLCALPADGQAAQVADAPITFDRLEAFEIQPDFAAQITFGDVLAVLNGVNDLGKLLLVQILGANGRVDTGFGKDLLSVHRSDAVNIAQSDIDAPFGWNIYSEDAWHIFLTLALFVAGISADHADHALAAHNLAVLAQPFY